MTYQLFIAIYAFLARIYAWFNKKAALLVKGQGKTYDILRGKVVPGKKYLWFHAASLGEFEQGRPLMEKIRAQHPEYGILLTFFSPSGYEVRKNYEGADIVCYLPFDRKASVRQFLDLAQPCMAFFIKYEFWKNYLDELHRRGIPTYSVSSIFRENQVFF
ncbi:MAG: 3-deoxy-D-manno-octulosonic acid transferase, partial [Bacteroidaceae bacterium]|nr:3-deoxy-D-manno-octulosonic acid transferase [Bacteroidaceae bacterium]